MSAPPDPFSPTADPAAYVPRAATERALAALEEGFRAGQRVQVLSGPPGHGKTLLARILAERLAGSFRPLYLPYASLPPEELGSWVLGLLEEDSRQGWRGLRELACASADRPLLLLVDEANSIPEDSAVQLDELLLEANAGLRLLLIPAEEPPPNPVLSRMVSGAMELRLNAPLSAEEAQLYLDARLTRAGTPASVREVFRGEMAERLLRASEGIPSEIHRLATEVLRGNLEALPELVSEEETGAEVDSDGLFAVESGAPAATTLVEGSGGFEFSGARRAGAAHGDPPALPDSAPDDDSPFALPETEHPGMVWIVSVNLAIAAAMFGLLWWLGYIPPPH